MVLFDLFFYEKKTYNRGRRGNCVTNKEQNLVVSEINGAERKKLNNCSEEVVILHSSLIAEI